MFESLTNLLCESIYVTVIIKTFILNQNLNSHKNNESIAYKTTILYLAANK